MATFPLAPRDYTIYKYYMREPFRTASIGNDPLYMPIAMWDPPGKQFPVYTHNMVSEDRSRIVIGDFGFIDAGMYIRVRNCIMPDEPMFHQHRADPLPANIPPLALSDSTPLTEEDFPLPENKCICTSGLKVKVVTDQRTSQQTVVVEECLPAYAGLLYIPYTARRWEIPMKNSKKDVASYFHRHYDGLLHYYQLEAGGLGKREPRDVFLVRGYVKTQMYLTATLAEVTGKYLEGFEASRWPLPADDDPPTAEELYRSQALLRFDYSKLNDDEKRWFTGLYLAGPEVKLYDPKFRRPTRKLTNDTASRPVGASGDDNVPSAGASSSAPQPGKSGGPSALLSPKRTNLSLQPENEIGASSSHSEPASPLPFSQRLLKSLDDPHDQCVAIYPIRYRPRSAWIPKIFAGAEPQDPDYHRDDDTNPAVTADVEIPDQDDPDPLHHLLNYILEYSDADAAVADIEDVMFALEGHEEVKSFRVFLEKTRPRIYVSDENVGTLWMDGYLPNSVLADASVGRTLSSQYHETTFRLPIDTSPHVRGEARSDHERAPNPSRYAVPVDKYSCLRSSTSPSFHEASLSTLCAV